ncbi:MAG: hypothetical protein JWP09_540 [Candidatus Taylorbacteria bacterium]|nr:hypothetical protein [Candidatus Taylorbacteria bacterium]
MHPLPTDEIPVDLDRLPNRNFLEVLFSATCTEHHIAELTKRLGDSAQKDILLSAARDGIAAYANLKKPEVIPKSAYAIFSAFAKGMKVHIDYSRTNHRQSFMALYVEINVPY